MNNSSFALELVTNWTY